MITATQMHTEHEAIITAYAAGRIAKAAARQMVKHLDRLNNRQATTFERALWMALAAGQSEDSAHVAANRAQYLADLVDEAHEVAMDEAAGTAGTATVGAGGGAGQAPAVRGS